MRGAFSIPILLLLLAAPGCSKSSDSALPIYTGANLPSTNLPQWFQVKGVVREVKPGEKSVTIQHEEIPGHMPAMTMPFDVRDTNELAGLEAGDPVSFRLNLTDTEGWIDQIRKTGPRTNLLPAGGPIRRARDVEPLSEGDLLPEYHFTNELGRAFSTTEFKGQALAIEFLFTRCPLPDFCPRMANNFEAAQDALLAMTNAPVRWHLLTLSFDAEFDTPTVLKAYAENHHYDSSRWTFAAGDLADITAIGEQFGFTFWHDETGSLSHNLRTAVIDASGRVQKIFVGNQWTPGELVSEMVKAAASK